VFVLQQEMLLAAAGGGQGPPGTRSPPEPPGLAAGSPQPPVAIRSRAGSSLRSLLGWQPGTENGLGCSWGEQQLPDPPGDGPPPRSPNARQPLGKSWRVPWAWWGGGSVVGGVRNAVQNVPLKGKGSILLKRE